MAVKQVDFYFDLMSPYAYLASTRLPELRRRYDKNVSFVLHPLDMLHARFKAGNTGPSNRDIPAKIRCLMADLKRWPQRYGIPFEFPKTLNSSRLNRGFLCAKRLGLEDKYLRHAYEDTWGQGGDPDDDALIKSVAEKAGLNAGTILKDIASPEIVAEYEAETQAAEQRGVFGVPIFMLDDEMFWGSDRIEFVQEYLDKADKR